MSRTRYSCRLASYPEKASLCQLRSATKWGSGPRRVSVYRVQPLGQLRGEESTESDS